MISRRDALKRTVVVGAVAGTAGMVGGAAFIRVNKDHDESDQSSSSLTEQESTQQQSPVAQKLSEVGDKGFDITLGSVRVSAPAGVASLGTKVLVATAAGNLPTGLENFTTSIGNPVRVVLGDDEQPAQPVTIVFDMTNVQQAMEASEESPLVALAYSETEDTYFLMDAAWDADNDSLTVTSDHLTDFWPIKIDLPDMVEDLIAKLALNYSYSKPECAYMPLDANEVTFSISQAVDDSVWPCMRQQDSNMVLDLHSNSILPWAVVTAPEAPASITGSFSSLGPVLEKVYSGFFSLMGGTRSAVLPGNTTSYQFSLDQLPVNFEFGDPPAASVHLEIEPGLFLATTLLWEIQTVLDILLKGKAPDDLIDGVGALDCVLGVIDTVQEVTDDSEYLGIVNTMLVCIKESIVVEGKNWVEKAIAQIALAIVSLFAGGAGLVATAIIGATKTLTSNNQIDFAITAETPWDMKEALEPAQTAEPVQTVTADSMDGFTPAANESSTSDQVLKAYGPDGDIYVINGETYVSAAQVSLDIESRDGYKAKLSISVGPEIGYRGEVPPHCEITFIDASASDFYFRSRRVEFSLESIQVNGFDWPSTRPVKVYHQGYVPCGPTPDGTADFWALEVFAGHPKSLELVLGRGMSPAYPDGNFDGTSQLTLVVEGSTQESCELISDSSGLRADFGDDFGDNWSWDNVSGCRLKSIDNATYEVD